MEIFNDLIDRSHQTNDYERALQANRSLAEIIIEPHLLEERNANRSNIDIALSMITDAVQAGSNTASAKAVHTMCLLSDIQILKGNLSKAEVFISPKLKYLSNLPAALTEISQSCKIVSGLSRHKQGLLPRETTIMKPLIILRIV